MITSENWEDVVWIMPHNHLRDLGRNIVELKTHTNAFMLVLQIWEEILLTMLHYVRDLGRDIVN